MVCERFNCYFSFGTVFYPFTTLTAQKTKILKKWKKHLKISSFCICVQKIFDQMMYSSWDMVCDRFNCYFNCDLCCYFGLFFALLPLEQPKKGKFWKNEKSSGYIFILHMCTKNYDQIIYGSWDMLFDRRMDGRTEKVAFRGECTT